MSSRIVIDSPKQSKPTPVPKKKNHKQKCTVLEWIRNGYRFQSKSEHTETRS